MWQPNIKINISGATMICDVSEGLAGIILEDVEDILPSAVSKRDNGYVNIILVDDILFEILTEKE
jgi:hypothetical protein